MVILKKTVRTFPLSLEGNRTKRQVLSYNSLLLSTRRKTAAPSHQSLVSHGSGKTGCPSSTISTPPFFFFLSFIVHGESKIFIPAHCLAWEYKKVPRTAMAAPRALTGWTGVRKMIMEETMTDIRFMVFPMLNVKGEISSKDMYET